MLARWKGHGRQARIGYLIATKGFTSTIVNSQAYISSQSHRQDFDTPLKR